MSAVVRMMTMSILIRAICIMIVFMNISKFKGFMIVMGMKKKYDQEMIHLYAIQAGVCLKVCAVEI